MRPEFHLRGRGLQLALKSAHLSVVEMGSSEAAQNVEEAVVHSKSLYQALLRD